MKPITSYDQYLQAKQDIRDLYRPINRAQTGIRSAKSTETKEKYQAMLDDLLPRRQAIKESIRTWQKENGKYSPNRKSHKGNTDKYPCRYRGHVVSDAGENGECKVFHTLKSAIRNRNNVSQRLVASGELSEDLPHSMKVSVNSFYTTYQALTGYRS